MCQMHKLTQKVIQGEIEGDESKMRLVRCWKKVRENGILGVFNEKEWGGQSKEEKRDKTRRTQITQGL